MKKNFLLLAACVTTSVLWSCNDNNSSQKNDDGTTVSSSLDTSASGTQTMNTNDSASTMESPTGTTGMANKGPLAKEDSVFVMKAAMAGMMEVQAGQIAQQNAANQRVKAFGAMMVNDHTKSNQELMALASSHGLTIPQELPADMKKHMQTMQGMQGSKFDSHYMSMMLNDHKKDISDFQKQANSGKDEELKAWAAKTLPVLQMHRDSATAINKAKM